jgi:flagellar motor switch protein FliG
MTNPVPGPRKAAILLLSLDSDLAAEVLAKLPRDLVERVTLSIAAANHVARNEQEAVLHEFKNAIESRALVAPTGPETARQLLESTLDQSEVEVDSERNEQRIAAGPFAFLHQHHPDDLRRMVSDERPQTIAVIAAQLPPALASRMLAGFEVDRQADILGRLSRLGPTDSDVLAEIAELLRNRLSGNPVRAGGVVQTAEIVRTAEPLVAQTVLNSLEKTDPTSAGVIRESLFSFSDIEFLDDESLSHVIQATSDVAWAIALKGCSDSLKSYFYSQFSPDLADSLKHEVDALGPTSLSETTSARRRVIEAVLNLEAEGRIQLPSVSGGPARRRERTTIHQGGTEWQ